MINRFTLSLSFYFYYVMLVCSNIYYTISVAPKHMPFLIRLIHADRGFINHELKWDVVVLTFLYDLLWVLTVSIWMESTGRTTRLQHTKIRNRLLRDALVFLSNSLFFNSDLVILIFFISKNYDSIHKHLVTFLSWEIEIEGPSLTQTNHRLIIRLFLHGLLMSSSLRLKNFHTS